MFLTIARGARWQNVVGCVPPAFTYRDDVILCELGAIATISAAMIKKLLDRVPFGERQGRGEIAHSGVADMHTPQGVGGITQVCGPAHLPNLLPVRCPPCAGGPLYLQPFLWVGNTPLAHSLAVRFLECLGLAISMPPLLAFRRLAPFTIPHSERLAETRSARSLIDLSVAANTKTLGLNANLSFAVGAGAECH